MKYAPSPVGVKSSWPPRASFLPAESKPLRIKDYAWSADTGKVLIFTNTQRVWRQKTRGDYWVFDRETASVAANSAARPSRRR